MVEYYVLKYIFNNYIHFRYGDITWLVQPSSNVIISQINFFIHDKELIGIGNG